MVEIDGESHREKGEQDHKRQSELEDMTIQFLRFQDDQVKRNMPSVLQVIQNWIEQHDK